MLAVVLALVPGFVAGWLAARWACPGPRSFAAGLLRLSLGSGLALGFTSITYFLWLLWAGPGRPCLLLVELTVFGLLIGVFAALNWRAAMPPSVSPSPRPRLLGIALLLALACALVVGGMQMACSPHGDIDAFAIWNQHARFLYRGGDAWRDSFTSLSEWAHPDYPLLVPANVARCWTYAGEETTLAPQLLAVVFAAATAGSLVSGVALLRTPSQGWLAGIVLLATPKFVELTTAQYADVPLGFSFLGSVLLFEMYDRLEVKSIRLPLLAGLLAGMAAWTKNEGQLFLVATLLARGVTALGRKEPWDVRCGELLAFAAGLAPFLGCLAYFKLRLAPANDLVEGQNLSATWQRLMTLDRYRVVGLETLSAVARLGLGAGAGLPVYGLLAGLSPQRPRPGLHAAMVLGVMLAGYTLIYLTTPHDVTWHLVSSVDRLLMQLWPMAILLFFLRFAAPEDMRRRT